MSSERWRRIEEVFERALERPPEERAAFLDRACADDETLRQAVASMLAADQEGAAFLEEPLVPSPASASPAPLPSGGRVGSYRLLRQIGQGGMSTVFLAVRDDDTFQRRAAIKILRRGMESEDAQRRLRVERQILASLDHPSIARLYDGGTTDSGLPYFAMEYVEGLAIDAYCDHHQMPISARIELFRKVCSAVHYAHQNLVVHRDLKPSNILVTADGVPKLLDFGIAKLLNPELSSSELAPTATWCRALTPQYASPEQLRGDPITTATDVYSLGILLYKLLTGRLPFRLAGRTPQEVERIRSEDGPTRPSTVVTQGGEGSGGGDAADEPPPETISRARSTRPEQLARRLAGDLDNIVLMALRIAPERRYSSVEQLAEDLHRYATGFPVLARPDELPYRLGKFVRRHAPAVVISAVIVLMLVSFAVAMALQSARVARERDQARQERDEKEQVLALVEDVFKLADPGEAKGETFTVREALDRSAERIEPRLGDHPAMEAALRRTLGTIYLNLGLLGEAELHLAEVLDLRRRLDGEQSMEVSESLSALGAVFREQGRYDRAEAYTLEAVTRARRLLGDEHPGLIRPLNHLVTLRCYQGDYRAADEPSRQALALAREFLDDTRSELAVAVTNRAVVVRNNGDLETADSLYQEGLALQRRILGEDHPEVANILNNLAVVSKEQGDLAASERLHREALALRRKLYGEEHAAVAQSLTNLASVLRARGDHGRAEAHYREAAAILRRRLGPSHPLTIKVAVTLGNSLLEGGQAPAAEQWLREQIETWRADLPEGDGLLAWAENALGEALTALQRYDEAERVLVTTFDQLQGRYGESHPKTRQALERLVALYTESGRPEDAQRYSLRLAASGPSADR